MVLTRVYPEFLDRVYKKINNNTHWEATQRVMVSNLTRLTHKIAIQLHLVTALPFAVLTPGGQSRDFWIHLCKCFISSHHKQQCISFLHLCIDMGRYEKMNNWNFNGICLCICLTIPVHMIPHEHLKSKTLILGKNLFLSWTQLYCYSIVR